MIASPSALDCSVSERQAFGPGYARPAHLESALQRYRDGILRLPPHPDWSGEFTQWTANPFGDRNWQFQHHSLRWVNPLRWAALEGDATARTEWVRVARSWFEANVPAEQAIGDFAWTDMADGNRAVQFVLGAPLIADEDRWFIDLLVAHREWLMDDSHIVGGNHGLHQNVGLLVVGAALRDVEAMEKARDRMLPSFEAAFDSQGCNEEGSSAYHQMNIRWWRQAWDRIVAEGLDVPPHVTERLDLACEVLAHLAQPNGELPQIGDSARTSLVKGLSESTDFVAYKGARGNKPSATSLVLSGGYAISRSGWGEARDAHRESHMVVRHGPFARAHGHYDSGSVNIFASGRRWLTDPGFHSYQTGDKIRRHLASRTAHNVPVLAGLQRDETQPFDLERANTTAEVDDFLLVDRGYIDAYIERRVTYLRGPDCWLVWDRGIAEEPVVLEQHWQTDVGVFARYRDHGFRLHDDASSLTMTWLGDNSRRVRHDAVDGNLKGWVGTRWKTLERGSHLTASTLGQRPQLIALIGAHSDLALGLIDSHLAQSGHLSISVARGTELWNVVLNGPAVNVDLKQQMDVSRR